MGAENSVLEGCDWGDKLPCPNEFQWNVYPVSKHDGMEAVVLQPKNSDKKENTLLQKSAKMLKQLRHPNIVRYLGCGTSPDGFWLAVEPVTPLLAMTSTVNLTMHELLGGLWDILQALDFLHSTLGVCHNNICPASIYVSKDGTWKLGGMEHVCKFLEATPEFLESTRSFRNEKCLSPEEKTGKVKQDVSVVYARDIFSLGALVDAVTDFVKEKDDLMMDLERQMTPCVSADPSARPSTSTLIKSSLFRSDFIEIVAFIKNVTLKTEVQKKEFFSSLLPRLQQLPEEVIARKLALPLLSRFVLLDETAEEQVVPALLIPRSEQEMKSESQSLLCDSLFQSHIIPHLCNVFRVHDCHIRLVMLKHFHQYAHLFSREQLEDHIFLQVLLGIRDTDDRLVAASLRALADLVPLLGGDYVIGGSRKCFFFHGIPKAQSAEAAQGLSLSTANVTTLLPSARTPLLKDTNHKPLLKDLAHDGKDMVLSSTLSSEDKERKLREREQRREEAKLKREERRLKAKTKQIRSNETSAKMEATSDKKLTLTIEKVAALDKDEKYEDVESIELSLIEEKEGELFFSLDPDKKEEEDKPDWSDWEDADGNFSDEIEEELKNMTGERGFQTEGKVSTSPNPYQIDDTLVRLPPMQVDWSDVPENFDRNAESMKDAAKGPLSLGRTTGNTVQSIHDNNNSSSIIKSNELQEMDSHHSSFSGAKVLRLKDSNLSSSISSSSSSSLSSATNKKTANLKKAASRSKVNDDLGSGYDIKSIEIKSKSTKTAEDDLFADMAPVISSTISSDPIKDMLSSMGNMESTVKTESKLVLTTATQEDVTKTIKNSTLFAVDTSVTREEEEAGWGDDDGWDADF